MPSEQFRQLFVGRNEQCHLRVPVDPPPWLDKEKLRRGQRYFREDNSAGILFCCLRNLVAGLALPSLCYPLVLTSKSETRKKAFSRYWDTVAYVYLWYIIDPVNNRKTYEDVNKYHKAAFKKIQSLSIEDMRVTAEKKIAELPDSERIYGDEELDDVLFTNLRELRETQFNEEDFHYYKELLQSETRFNELDMSLTQMAFYISVLHLPEEFGAKHSSKEDLEGLCHLWRVNGYYLGVSDQYQATKDGVDETLTLLDEILKYIIIPAFLHLDRISVHMGKVICRGRKMDYHLLIYSHYLIHGLELNHLWQKFTIKQKIMFYWRYFFMHYLHELPFIRRWIAKATDRLLSKHSLVKRLIDDT